jgi:hypothetical protein
MVYDSFKCELAPRSIPANWLKYFVFLCLCRLLACNQKVYGENVKLTQNLVFVPRFGEPKYGYLLRCDEISRQESVIEWERQTCT